MVFNKDGWKGGKLISFESHYESNCLNLMFKILNGTVPGSFEEIFVRMPGENRANSYSIPFSTSR